MIKKPEKCLDVVNVYSSSAKNGNAEFFYITDYKKVIKSNKVWSFEKSGTSSLY
jgi:predicted secreted protein